MSKVHGITELGRTNVRVCDGRRYYYGCVWVEILHHIVFECGPLQVSDNLCLRVPWVIGSISFKIGILIDILFSFFKQLVDSWNRLNLQF